MSDRPLVTFIIAIYNVADYLQRCLDSIYAQSLPSWEIVVIDGGSTDGTVEILEANTSRLSFWISEPDQGIYDAWNKALPHVKGDWFHFLGADDWLLDDTVLQRVAPVLTAPENAAYRIIYAPVRLVSDQNSLVETIGKPWEQTKQHFLREMNIPHQGVFHHRSLIDEGRRFDANLRYSADYAFLLEDIVDHPPLFVPGPPVAAWTQGGVTSNPALALAVLSEAYHVRRRMGLKGTYPAWQMAKAWTKGVLARRTSAATTARIVNMYRRITGRPPRP